MAALSADAQRDYKEVGGHIADLPMAVDTIYKGGLVALNAAGYLAPAGDTVGDVVVGIAIEQVANAGSAGDKRCRFISGVIVDMPTAADVGQTSVGVLATVSDDSSVDIAANTTNDIAAGVILEYVSSSEVKLYIPPFGMTSAL